MDKLVELMSFNDIPLDIFIVLLPFLRSSYVATQLLLTSKQLEGSLKRLPAFWEALFRDSRFRLAPFNNCTSHERRHALVQRAVSNLTLTDSKRFSIVYLDYCALQFGVSFLPHGGSFLLLENKTHHNQAAFTYTTETRIFDFSAWPDYRQFCVGTTAGALAVGSDIPIRLSGPFALKDNRGVADNPTHYDDYDKTDLESFSLRNRHLRPIVRHELSFDDIKRVKLVRKLDLRASEIFVNEDASYPYAAGLSDLDDCTHIFLRDDRIDQWGESLIWERTLAPGIVVPSPTHRCKVTFFGPWLFFWTSGRDSHFFSLFRLNSSDQEGSSAPFTHVITERLPPTWSNARTSNFGALQLEVKLDLDRIYVELTEESDLVYLGVVDVAEIVASTSFSTAFALALSTKIQISKKKEISASAYCGPIAAVAFSDLTLHFYDLQSGRSRFGSLTLHDYVKLLRWIDSTLLLVVCGSVTFCLDLLGRGAENAEIVHPRALVQRRPLITRRAIAVDSVSRPEGSESSSSSGAQPGNRRRALKRK